MTRNEIDSLVAENRERIRSVSGRVTQVSTRRDRDLSFGISRIEVEADATVSTRSTGDQILFGHADDAHGFGRGTFGDDKGEWVDRNVSVSAEFTRRGRRAVVDALDGRVGAVASARAGTGTTAPDVDDTGLTNAYASTPTANGRPAPKTTGSTGDFDAASWVGDPVEFGIFDRNNRLLARFVADTSVAVDAADEVRINATLTFVGDGVGNSVVTDDGDDAIADSMARRDDVVGLSEFRFGRGTSEFTKSDSSLSDEAFAVGCSRLVSDNRIIARSTVREDEPANQPVDVGEIGVFTGDGRMVWAVAIRVFTKQEGEGANVESEFRVI